MSKPRALIVGGSIAGPTTAFWLVRSGFAVTLVELSPRLRPGGNGVDVREQAILVAEQMGLMNRIRAGATDLVGMRFVSGRDHELARIDLKAMQATGGSLEVEVPRGDLAAILHDVTSEDVEYTFGDTVVSIDQDSDGVDVTFERGAPQRFDLVIGADGLHSSVRRLAFGPDAGFVQFKHHYFAVATVESAAGENRWVSFYNEPGKAAATYRPGNYPAKAHFAFYRRQPLDYDYRNIDQQRRIVHETFAGMGWHVAELLAGSDAASDFYFDALSQVHMPAWSTGRVVLVGDAAYCASPAAGAGATLSMVGAYRLAGELKYPAAHPQAAFRRYEAGLRPLVSKKQAGLFTSLMVPKSRAGIWARNAFLRSPLVGLLSGLESRIEANLPEYPHS